MPYIDSAPRDGLRHRALAPRGIERWWCRQQRGAPIDNPIRDNSGTLGHATVLSALGLTGCGPQVFECVSRSCPGPEEWLNWLVGGVFHADEQSYDDFMGRYSVRLAPLFADFAGVAEGERVLDVGAGTGALTRELVARGAVVVALEPSPEFTRALRSRFPEMEVHEAPAEDLPFADDSFDVAVAQLVVAFMEDATAAMRELGRVAHRVAICMWGVEEVQMFAAIGRTARLIGSGSAEHSARRYRTPHELHDLLEGAGLANVETCELDVTASYADFDEFWRALGLQVGPAGAWLHGLDDQHRARAHDELHRQLGSPNGAFELHGRAYGARATRWL